MNNVFIDGKFDVNSHNAAAHFRTQLVHLYQDRSSITFIKSKQSGDKVLQFPAYFPLYRQTLNG